MKVRKLIPAPIDNKNVLEDFTYVLHADEYIETRRDGVVKQAYWDDGNLWVVVYQFARNWFHVHLIQEGRNWQASARRMKDGIESLEQSEGITVTIHGDVEVDMKDFYRCTLWFKPEEE